MSSVAVPVTVKVRELWTPDGPVTELSGVSSARPKVSNFLIALVASLVRFTPTVLACTRTERLPVNVTGRDQVEAVASGEARVASMPFHAPQVARSSWRYRPVLRSMISSETCRTPDAAVAVPVMTDCCSVASTRPSMGVVIVVSLAPAAGTLPKS